MDTLVISFTHLVLLSLCFYRLWKTIKDVIVNRFRLSLFFYIYTNWYIHSSCYGPAGSIRITKLVCQQNDSGRSKKYFFNHMLNQSQIKVQLQRFTCISQLCSGKRTSF